MKLFIALLIAVAVMLLLPAFITVKYPEIAVWLEDKTYLNLVAVLGLVISAVSLAFAFFQFQSAQQNQRKLAERQLASRFATLEAELRINVHVCANELLKSQACHDGDDALPVPESRFHTTILEQALGRGDIVQSDLRNALWNLYRLMSTANSLLTQAGFIRHTEHIADPRDQMLTSGRRSKVNDLVNNAMAFTKQAQTLLAQTQQEVQELIESNKSITTPRRVLRHLWRRMC